MSSLTDTLSLLNPQDRADQGLLRALGREVLRSLPPVDYAFSYGSSAMPQFDFKTGERESLESMLGSIDFHRGDKMFDMILGVENTWSWHDQNIDVMKNKHHYSFLGRTLRSHWNSIESGVFFHPGVPISIQDRSLRDAGVPEIINVKYGITSLDNMVTDCTTWTSLYLAGRLHKPVTVLHENPHMALARELNLHHAVAYALLQLPPTFSELDLYSKIAGISYEGDVRAKYGAEDVNKVTKLVHGALPFFRDLYGGILNSYLHGAATNTTLDQPLPIYSYHTSPLVGGVGARNTRHLPIFNQYVDVYNQMTTSDPSKVIFSQPDTLQHRAMLYASLPAYLTIHRATGFSKLNKAQEDEQHKANEILKAAKDANYAKNKRNDGSDQSGIRAPIPIGAETPADVASNASNDPTPTQAPSFLYRPPRTELEKQIPVLPPVVQFFPHSTISYSFGPNMLESPLTSFSPFQKFDRQKIFLRDKRKIQQLLTQSANFRPFQKVQSPSRTLPDLSSSSFIETDPNRTNTTNPTATSIRQFSTFLRPQSFPQSKRQSASRQRKAKFSTKPQQPKIPASHLSNDSPTFGEFTAVLPSDSINTESNYDHLADVIIDIEPIEQEVLMPEAIIKPIPAAKAKVSSRAPRKLTIENSDEEDEISPQVQNQNQTQQPPQPPPQQNSSPSQQTSTFLKSPSANIKRTQPTLTTLPHDEISSSESKLTNKLLTPLSSSNRLNLVSTLYTTTVSDILSIEQTLETPRQLLASNLTREILRRQSTSRIVSNNGQLDTILQSKPLFHQIYNEAAESINTPNAPPETLLLPTVTPLPLDQALDHHTKLAVLNVSKPNETSVHAVEIPINSFASDPHNKKKNVFTPWNHFNTISTMQILKELPIVPASNFFTEFQKEIKSNYHSTLKSTAHSRTGLIIHGKRLENDIADLKKQIEGGLIKIQSQSQSPTIDHEKDDKQIKNDHKTQINAEQLAAPTALTTEVALEQIRMKESELSQITEMLSDTIKHKPNAVVEYEKGISNAYPALFKAIGEISTLLRFSGSRIVGDHVDARFIGAVTPSKASLGLGLAIQDKTNFSYRTTLHPSKHYLGLLIRSSDWFKSKNASKTTNAPTYSLLDVPQFVPTKDSAPKKMIHSLVSSAMQFRNIDRQKIEADPWHYDRQKLPAFDDIEDNSELQVSNLVSAGGLPEGGINKFTDRRQRWQVFSSYDDAQQAKEIELLGKELSSNDSTNSNASPILQVYKTALASKYINVKSAQFDARTHVAGVARLDNSVNGLQLLATTKFPIFGASLMSAQLRQDIMPVYRHHFLSQTEIQQGDDQGDQVSLSDGASLKVLPFSHLVRPLTSLQALRGYVTDVEFTEQLKTGTITPNIQKGKPVEFFANVIEWEKVLSGDYSTPNATHNPETILQTIVSTRAKLIVENGSKVNARLAFWTAGPIRSIQYALRKLRKGRESKNASTTTFSPPQHQKASMHTASKRSLSTHTRVIHPQSQLKQHHLQQQQQQRKSNANYHKFNKKNSNRH